MRNARFAAVLAAASALSLAACDDSDQVAAVPADTMQSAPVEETEEGLPVGGDLNEQQQANYDALDRTATSEEFDRNRDAMLAEIAASDGSQGDDASEDGDAAMSGDDGPGETPTGNGMNDDGPDPASAEAAGSGAMGGGVREDGIRARSAMDFAYLDRDDDDRLSVAEYAIWAIPADPDQPEANDQTKPYLSQDQINEAGQTFFYFDADGSTYLSEEEFNAARQSARTPGR